MKTSEKKFHLKNTSRITLNIGSVQLLQKNCCAMHGCQYEVFFPRSLKQPLICTEAASEVALAVPTHLWMNSYFLTLGESMKLSDWKQPIAASKATMAAALMIHRSCFETVSLCWGAPVLKNVHSCIIH